MKIQADRHIETPSEETLTISISWNPSNDIEDGYAALLATQCDLIRKILALEEALENMEFDEEYRGT